MIRAVLGGSFDPVHDGHVAMAVHLLDEAGADRVHVVPARLSPFKTRHEASAEQRVAMLELAFAHRPDVVIDTSELDRPGPSWTVETLGDLAAAHPGDRLVLALGQDNLPELGRWRDIHRVLELAELYVFPRRGGGGVPDARELLARQGLRPDALRVAGGFEVPVASREVRAMLAAGEDVSAQVPEAVVRYIRARGLYRA